VGSGVDGAGGEWMDGKTCWSVVVLGGPGWSWVVLGGPGWSYVSQPAADPRCGGTMASPHSCKSRWSTSGLVMIAAGM
jgi:hypothetical protein